jgi:hypothetical protein
MPRQIPDMHLDAFVFMGPLSPEAHATPLSDTRSPLRTRGPASQARYASRTSGDAGSGQGAIRGELEAVEGVGEAGRGCLTEQSRRSMENQSTYR